MAENHEQTTQKNVEPLLYIQQPKFETPKRQMQDIYVSTTSIEEKAMDKPVVPEEEVKKVKRKPMPFVQPLEEIGELPIESEAKVSQEEGEVEESVSALDYFRKQQNVTKRKSWSFTPVKSFRDMEIPEKLQYLSRFPSDQQPFPCEFATQEGIVKGTLHHFGNEQIIVKTAGNEEVEIKTADIRTIRIAMNV